MLYDNGGTLGELTVTGSGSAVLATSPSLTTPTLGVASATTVNKVTITAPASGSTSTIADGKTLTVSNTLTLAGTDGSTLNVGSGGTLGSLALLSSVNNGKWSGTAIAIGNGGTGQTGASAAFNALSPMTTAGDIIYGGVSGAGTRLAARNVIATAHWRFNPIMGSRQSRHDGYGESPCWQSKQRHIGTSSTFWRGDGSWATPAGGGNVSNTGTPTNGQIAQWTSSTVIQGLDVNGSGNVVLTTRRAFTTPTLGVASATTINKLTITAPATGSTLTIADGKTLTASNTLTFTGTDASSIAFGTGGTVLYANQSITLSGDVTGSGTTAITTTVAKIAGVSVGTPTGTTNVVFSNSPTLVTPALGVASATSINKVAITAPASSATLAIAGGKTLTASNSITLAGTDSTTMTFPSTSDTVGGLGITQTWTGQNTYNVARTIASATAAVLDDIFVQAATATITGSTGSPITKLNKVGLYQPTLTDSSSVTVTDASTLYIDNAPAAGGSVTITNAWALRVGTGNVKFPGTGNVLGTITSGTWNGSVIGGTYGGTGVNNGSSTITIGASLTTTGAGAPTLAFPSSSFTYTFQASSDTVVGRATTDTLTNKTFDTAGTGNVFKINGTGISAITGTGSAVLATSPSLTTPTLGVASATTINKVTITTPATGSTLTIVDGKTLSASNTLTLAGTDSTTMTFPSSSATILAANLTAQTISGGARVTAFSIGTVSSGTTTLDSGNGPLQYLTNNGAFTLAAPSNDGSLALETINGASAGAITFSGFTVGSNTGDALTTTNTNKFVIFVVRINGTATYTVKALQ